jgi:hypothetical protein
MGHIESVFQVHKGMESGPLEEMHRWEVIDQWAELILSSCLVWQGYTSPSCSPWTGTVVPPSHFYFFLVLKCYLFSLVNSYVCGCVPQKMRDWISPMSLSDKKSHFQRGSSFWDPLKGKEIQTVCVLRQNLKSGLCTSKKQLFWLSVASSGTRKR